MTTNVNIPHSSPWITDGDVSEITTVAHSGMISKGALVLEFERRCSDYLGLPYVRSTGSGQAALFNAINALGLKPGSLVLMPSYVCRAVKDAVKASGCEPSFCDVGDDWCINPQTVKRAITPNVSAIIVVHPFGIIADVNSLKSFGLPIIEDCCQCFSPDVGSRGDIAVYSFHATKCLTTGEGGMVGTSNRTLAARLATDAEDAPDASRLTDLQAALGISQLSRYDEMLLRRKAIANRYFKNLPGHVLARLKAVADRSIFFRFPISIGPDFIDISEKFNQFGVQVRRGVDTLLHHEVSLKDEGFSKTVELFETTLSLPLYPALDEGSIKRILSVAEEVL